MTVSLPSFSLADYSDLLCELHSNGYRLSPVSRMTTPSEPREAYLRHDVDLDPALVLPMARAEQAMQVQSTYYLPLTLPFNLLHPPVHEAVRELVALGHEIGLHYDMESYPHDVEEAKAYLSREAALLERICEAPVRTICMHNPHRGEGDPFLETPDFLHPHAAAFQEGLCYISDSCRAWRDESLLRCLGPDAPARLLLNTHPELWLDGTRKDRMDYLEGVLRHHARQQVDAYYEAKVANVWKTHAGARQHDERENPAPDS